MAEKTIHRETSEDEIIYYDLKNDCNKVMMILMTTDKFI